MLQDTESGREAVRFSREMYRKVAEYLGAKLVPGKSNNAIWNDKKINIKSAHLENTKIAATENNLAWAHSIIAAIQEDNQHYGVYEVTSDWFKKEMRPSRQPYNMMVECAKIKRFGKRVGEIPV
jgi:hypothetical protein